MKRILLSLLLTLSANSYAISIMDAETALSLYTSDIPFEGSEDHECLIKNIYHESEGESTKGQIIVGQITLRRESISFRGASNLCQVVYDHYQFQWTREDKRYKTIDLNNANWVKAIQVAYTVLYNKLPDYSKGATHFYNPDLTTPNWDWSKMSVIGDVGNHRLVREHKIPATGYKQGLLVAKNSIEDSMEGAYNPDLYENEP